MSLLYVFYYTPKTKKIFAFCKKMFVFRKKRDMIDNVERKGGVDQMPTYVPWEAKHTIRDLRIRANMSQNSAAKVLGISEPTLRKWENDSSSLTFRDMQRIAELYNIPLDYIFFGPDNAFSEK